ncbi:MAG: hypothetical protein A2289_12700 [Deltaproteobacteria bacterium RIFOXYA12_FULL_58_15]|nr:MAG: hypothetical protein A2289_12700 [Deltaproteobacteria bacterium RIFOXYA12_FULL_58_15]
MARRSRTAKQHKRTAEELAPPGMREELEGARLNMLAFFRALDRLHLAQDRPPELHELFELDADFAESLWGLDQPVGRYDMEMMTADTVASLLAIGDAVSEFLRTLSEGGWMASRCMHEGRPCVSGACRCIPAGPRSRPDRAGESPEPMTLPALQPILDAAVASFEQVVERDEQTTVLPNLLAVVIEVGKFVTALGLAMIQRYVDARLRQTKAERSHPGRCPS